MTTFGETNNNAGGDRLKPNFYVKWKGAATDGFFVYYDKEAGEEKQYKFEEGIVLNTAYNIQGWSEKHNTRLYSNRVEDLRDEAFVIKAGEELILEGMYGDNKEAIKDRGGNLHLVITMLDDEGNVVNVALKGSAFSKFVDVQKEINTNTTKVAFAEVEDGKRGAIKWKMPTFKAGTTITKEEEENAREMAQALKGTPKVEEELNADDVF